VIASLFYNDNELIEPLRNQVGDLYVIDACSREIFESDERLKENKYWAGNWHEFLMRSKEEFVWMLNSDVEGIERTDYFRLRTQMEKTGAFMITPSFNSPHAIFHQHTEIIRQVNWIDMTAPIINVKMFQELGGFDDYFKGYFADIDLCYRARRKGLKMYVYDPINIHHIGGYSVVKNNMWEQSNLGDADYLCRKWEVNYWSELCR
jgi:GT2 family glycosyltransferase